MKTSKKTSKKTTTTSTKTALEQQLKASLVAKQPAPEAAAKKAASQAGSKLQKKSGISTATIVAWLKTLGLAHTEQSTFHQLKGASGARLYVARSGDLGRIDVSGLQEIGRDGLKPYVYGAVRFQVVVDGRTEEQVRGTLERLARVLNTSRKVLEAQGQLVTKAKKPAKSPSKPATEAAGQAKGNTPPAGEKGATGAEGATATA